MSLCNKIMGVMQTYSLDLRLGRLFHSIARDCQKKIRQLDLFIIYSLRLFFQFEDVYKCSLFITLFILLIECQHTNISKISLMHWSLPYY